ncbi:MAG: FAD-dependent oxidoreductase [Proteobacteria bacterium]|nr:FAD-dependent oxidoreductase [Pseudomonadota bacterium]
MKEQAQVVVIGGGVVGCSVLYHLTKLGWRDVVLCERKELTAGSSWHAAGGFHALNSDPGVARLQAYTISLYKEIERESGQNIGLHVTGGLNVAATRDRWDFLRSDWARHKVLGLHTELIGPEQIRELCPLMDTSGVLGAIYDPMEGHLDPSGTTHAYAMCARKAGAEIYRHTRVLEVRPTSQGTWLVVTDGGTIEAEHVVNAGGLWARQVGQMVGLDLPIVAMEHHYLLTEDLEPLKQLEGEIPLVLDLDGEIYLRQERKGVLLGVYESEATPWAVNGTSWDYGENELLAPQLDRLTEALEKGFQRFPTLADAGIRRIVNGPFTFSPDGNPLVGPAPGLRNYWLACGVMAGFAQGGGVGLALAQWITRGEPDGDIFAMDAARFGPYTTRSYTVARTREFYSRRFQIAYPNEYWPAGRPAKTSPVHATLRAANGVFGVSYGLEVPLFFGAPEIPSLRRSNAFDCVRTECQAVQSGTGVLDITSFAKYSFSGPEAQAALRRLLAGRLPDVGRVRVTPMLAPTGRLMGDLTTMRLSEDSFLVTGSGYLQAWHMRWFAQHTGNTVRNISDAWSGIAVLGPGAREIVARVAPGLRDMPFMHVSQTDVGFAPALVARLSVSGELGYEIYVPAAYQQTLLELLLPGSRHVGLYALNAMRLEKSFGIWSREFSRDYTPAMAGLGRFIDYSRSDFIGSEAALRDREQPPSRRLVTLAVDVDDAEATGYEPIELEGRLVGYVTSGGFGHRVGQSLAMGYLDSAVPLEEPRLTVTVLGKPCAGRILRQPAYDPSGDRMRT